MSVISLSATVEISVRFSETDPMGIVWHGNYVKYLEDGREAFGKKYGFNYMDVFQKGLFAPVVKMDLNFKKPLLYNENAIVETTYVDSPAAKIQYNYKIFKKSGNELITTGSTTQVFVNENGTLILSTPPSFMEWKRKWGLVP